MKHMITSEDTQRVMDRMVSVAAKVLTPVFYVIAYGSVLGFGSISVWVFMQAKASLSLYVSIALIALGVLVVVVSLFALVMITLLAVSDHLERKEKRERSKRR